jgi:hypothetical protein
MSAAPFDPAAFVAAAARAVGIELDAAERTDVAAQLERIHGFARLVLDFELAPEEELAPRFDP